MSQQFAVIGKFAVTFRTFDVRSTDFMASALSDQENNRVIRSKVDAGTQLSIILFTLPKGNVE
jgi:hypothetical protein